MNPDHDTLATISLDGTKVKTNASRHSALYALRKQTVEPVFGIIKPVMGFRQFSLRELVLTVLSCFTGSSPTGC